MVRRILLLLAVLLIVPGLASARDESDVHIESEALGGADGDPGGGDTSPHFAEPKWYESAQYIQKKQEIVLFWGIGVYFVFPEYHYPPINEELGR